MRDFGSDKAGEQLVEPVRSPCRCGVLFGFGFRIDPAILDKFAVHLVEAAALTLCTDLGVVEVAHEGPAAVKLGERTCRIVRRHDVVEHGVTPVERGM